MKLLIVFIGIVSFWEIGFASTCSCTADVGSKITKKHKRRSKRTFLLIKRTVARITCTYSCRSPKKKASVVATHTAEYFSEGGDDVICEGAQIGFRDNPLNISSPIPYFKGVKAINPAGAKSKKLRDWARNNGCGRAGIFRQIRNYIR